MTLITLIIFNIHKSAILPFSISRFLFLQISQSIKQLHGILYHSIFIRCKLLRHVVWNHYRTNTNRRLERNCWTFFNSLFSPVFRNTTTDITHLLKSQYICCKWENTPNYTHNTIPGNETLNFVSRNWTEMQIRWILRSTFICSWSRKSALSFRSLKRFFF